MTSHNILVIEDNIPLAEVLQFNLEQANFAVTMAENGRVAYELVESGMTFDLILMDHQMPEMTGLEFCEKIRRHDAFRDIPVILLTAKRLELDLSTTLNELGIVACHGKPFSPSQIVQAVEQELVPLN